MKVTKAIKNIRFDRAENGAAFYKDGTNTCWYKRRSEMKDNVPSIQVDAATNKVLTFFDDLPADRMSIFISPSCPDMVVHVYQFDEFPATDFNDAVIDKCYYFDGKNLTSKKDTKTYNRTKDDILSELESLKKELIEMK